MFPASEHCAPCGGKCCAQVPGSTSPEDWGAPDLDAMRSRIAEALASGRWTVDRWYAEYHRDAPLDHDVLFVRPARKGWEGFRFDELEEPAWTRFLLRPMAHPCTFHSASGCELGADARPLECRTLEPMPSGTACKQHGGAKMDRALEWAAYQSVLPDEWET